MPPRRPAWAQRLPALPGIRQLTARALARRVPTLEKLNLPPELAAAPVGEGLVTLPPLPGAWRRLLDSSDLRWGGPGSQAPERLAPAGREPLRMNPHSFILFKRE